jgi:predicted DNA-binding helix-hairpin-helix protein
MRFYGFRSDELTTDEDRNLPLDKDPKLGWALRHREFFPVDVNKAGKEALLRIPGFGVRNVKRVVRLRRYRSLTLSDLAKLKIAVNRAQYFVVTADHNPHAKDIDKPTLSNQMTSEPEQLSLFSALSGEL